MFANTNLGVMNLGFPDVCLTPPFALPIPYPNIALSLTHIPSQFKVIIGGGLAENLLTEGTVSLGDMTGVQTGLISHEVAGQDQPVLGSFKVLYGTAFATRLTSINIQNGINSIGISLTPAQVVTLLLG
ncbi:DUF4150 domain-containing protein [Gallaecimonas mangrovi]|uniref:DUF4150 domain-containing protein n=1 Tax=Gallaecimonas mangrovi TaxID=2291597 RepID=UPI000E1FE6AD|nr:DUF4150 domain-containing protein [Gallaecimonas mangrovi]